MRSIHSRDNPDFRRWLRLAQGRRDRSAQLLIEGLNLCEAWLAHHGQPLAMLVDDALLSDARVQLLWQACKGTGNTERIALASPLARQLSRVEHGPAIFFVVCEPPASSWPNNSRTSVLLLDRIQDPGNLGTLLRTAAAAGLCHVFLSAGCARAWSAKVLRSAQGAHFALQLHVDADLAQIMRKLSLPVLLTDVKAGSSLYETDLCSPCAWLFGNEGQGVAKELLHHEHVRVRIPQAAAVESLNVAAAAAICLFEQRRQILARQSQP